MLEFVVQAKLGHIYFTFWSRIIFLSPNLELSTEEKFQVSIGFVSF